MPTLPIGARQVRFLIAEDSDDIRDVFCSFVRRTGHYILPTTDGVEATEVLQRESFDVLLLDLNMPRMDGVEVLQWLAAHPDVAPGMRVVVVTAHRQEHLTHLADLGVTTVIEKPFRLQRLNDLIAETLQDLEESEPIS
jgi:CheY-like chemotaxis protein